eukprot:Gregarina_sp_Pseudo_9__4417@NODE_457_length_2800_cov_122_591452_g433_i0_p1_GENE_NODE_457_length_2800_cov_122_591452_g433_i0NODE_457_length_2800_cov_122_591452_g433_i0_p1_ORF_typecomplete_len450_score103_04CDC50/PF03381_15/4_3e28DUF3188/PF11384_8/9_5DUF3188/PF11384_8/11_NODE_457_length_2800_cov_122_591452_g433_i09952344
MNRSGLDAVSSRRGEQGVSGAVSPSAGNGGDHAVWIESQAADVSPPGASGLRNRLRAAGGSSLRANNAQDAVDKIVITRSEVKRFGLRKVRRKLFKFRQQQFSHFMRLSSSFRRYNGAKLLAAIGIGLVIMGILVFGLTSEIAFTIPYDDATTSTTFQVQRDVTGPFFVYAKIDNFHANFRKFIESKPDYYKMGTCNEYDTVEAAWFVRPKESLPEIQNWASTSRVYPCGIAAFTYFNDQIELRAISACGDAEPPCEPRAIEISTTSVAPRELFSLYTRVPTEEEVQYQWLNPLKETRYQGWMYSTFSLEVLVLLGSLKDYTLYRGTHELNITSNLWPAAHFGAKKSIVIMSLGSLGARQRVLALMALGWGLSLICLALLFLWALRRNIVFASSSLVGVSPEELREQWILHATEWLDPVRSRPLGLNTNRSIQSRRKRSESLETARENA